MNLLRQQGVLMTNFDFLKSEPQFSAFASAAIAAEKVFAIDLSSCVLNCRRTMEIAVKWLYSVDRDLYPPLQDNLINLLDTFEFRKLVGNNLLDRLHYIRKLGNIAAHSSAKQISEDQTVLCLRDLFYFLDFIAHCYGRNYKDKEFNSALLKQEKEKPYLAIDPEEYKKSVVVLQKLLEENKALKAELSSRREEQKQTYVEKPLELSEFKTRKIYIDTMLQEIGWQSKRDWIDEYEVQGMPNNQEKGFIDYALLGDDGIPLAIIEAKKTCVDVSKGRQQAKLYADCIEKKYGKRPIIFLSNGFETHIIDNVYHERKVAAIYSKRDLERIYNLRLIQNSLANVMPKKDIAGRYYQIAAVKAVCDSFSANRRKALLVMATGSGKTRTVISLCEILLRQGWIKNFLFLADRTALVKQAKKNFVNLLPDLPVANICEEKDDYTAAGIFSTYQTMMTCIDEKSDENGKIFTCGHFDLVICDEAHRSIYNKYKDIFNYFDAPLLGLTATPKDEIDKNTYDVFELEKGIPTYGYDLAQAVKDKFLVSYNSIETKFKFIEDGITYDDLSDEEKEEYEEKFAEEDGTLPEKIESSALNEWLFNENTIEQVLDLVMTKGIKINNGEKLGKTIIFAKNHRHAEKIYEIFCKEYPHLPGYAKVIDNYLNYAQSAIDEFSMPNKYPQIAISVDMLDTGIDIPEVVNLVFFKKVLSKAKFWQMIGRGTRKCPGLIDGKDKDGFYIFDFFGNFEFFRENPHGKEAPLQGTLQGAIFKLKAEMVYKLQHMDYQTEDLVKFRESLVEDLLNKAKELNRKNFSIRQHLKCVEVFSTEETYKSLTYENLELLKNELAPLVYPDEDEINAVRFDSLMYGIELAYLHGKKNAKARKELLKKIQALSEVGSIQKVSEQKEFIEKILHTDYLDKADINDFEEIRNKLRELMVFALKGAHQIFDTNFIDEIISIEEHEAELDNDDLKNYKEKAEFYVRQHMNEDVIFKIKHNIPFTHEDISQLEKVLWSEIGTKNEYDKEFGAKPLGEFVRSIVGLDMAAAKKAFARYLDDSNLDSRQIYFVNQIVEYIVYNGILKDFTILQESPFTDRGSIVELFEDDISVWKGIKSVINEINNNAVVQ